MSSSHQHQQQQQMRPHSQPSMREMRQLEGQAPPGAPPMNNSSHHSTTRPSPSEMHNYYPRRSSPPMQGHPTPSNQFHDAYHGPLAETPGNGHYHQHQQGRYHQQHRGGPPPPQNHHHHMQHQSQHHYHHRAHHPQDMRYHPHQYDYSYYEQPYFHGPPHPMHHHHQHSGRQAQPPPHPMQQTHSESPEGPVQQMPQGQNFAFSGQRGDERRLSYPASGSAGAGPMSFEQGSAPRSGRPSNASSFSENRFSFSSIADVKTPFRDGLEGALSPSPPSIPPPPDSAKAASKAEPSKSTSSSKSKETNDKTDETPLGPLRESRSHNVQTEQPESYMAKRTNEASLVDEQQPKQKKAKTVDAASLLLNLHKKPNEASPDASATAQMAPESKTIQQQEVKQQTPPNPVEPIVPKVPNKYPRTLSLPSDVNALNSLHAFIRKELLEVFVLDESQYTKSGPRSWVGHVGLRCVHCARVREEKGMIPKEEAPMMVFYPRHVAEIYRLVTSWQRCHLKKCTNMPPNLREQYEHLRETDKSRGKTSHWLKTANEIGLTDIVPGSNHGVCFDLDILKGRESQSDQQTLAKTTTTEKLL